MVYMKISLTINHSYICIPAVIRKVLVYKRERVEVIIVLQSLGL